MNTRARRFTIVLVIAILEAAVIAGGCVFLLTRKPPVKYPQRPFADFQADQVESVHASFQSCFSYSSYDLSWEEIEELARALQDLVFYCQLDPSHVEEPSGGGIPSVRIELTDGTKLTLRCYFSYITLNSEVYAIDPHSDRALSQLLDSCAEKAIPMDNTIQANS
ncbi:hypothetical protein D1159_17630 [Pseudoflavonifractor sp. 524-17]|uniref:hypothetical protein n=1 Tax=Pseudoflavonifractor sp. 524-17 TaxID=2304577 RepID=UPI0013793BF0|nr:hypothetical protein [Pseudoflavonifractor sp. 524-17]NCE66340.1 hypothetical protein [Pseudoflavonifractor sp. 524-17]